MRRFAVERRAVAASAVVTLFLLAACGLAQMAPIPSRLAQVSVDSGVRTNSGAETIPVWSDAIQVPGAPWVRLSFSLASLGGSPATGESSTLRIISQADGAVQELDATEMAQWRNTSAYFNGEGVVLVLFAAPGSVNRIAVHEVTVGMPADGVGIQSICDGTDDRQLSYDGRAARLVPVGCTAWLIDDVNHCFLTAGHCADGTSMDVVEFNVPLSNSNGTIVHPPPSDQYPVDPASIQFTNGGVGNDWCYFGCFANSETGLTPYQAQGVYFDLVTPPAVSGQNIRITGYGTTSAPVSPTWNQVQKTHAGPYTSRSGTWLQYRTDTTGGNSGSPVINDTNDTAIGIHTHGGCGDGSGANSGTGSDHAGLQNALANPRGVCAAGLDFSLPTGRPTNVEPAGGTTMRVVVTGTYGHVPQPGTGIFHYDTGAGFVTAPMSVISDNVYDAVFPAAPCGTTIRYYVTAENTSGVEFRDPVLAPNQVYDTTSASQVVVVFEDDFETDKGWTVTNSGGLTDGAWNRGVPVGGGDRGDPPTDFDGSGACYLTDNVDGNSDVDGGTTYLASPTIDLSTGDAIISYARWFSNHTGGDPLNDVFQVWISNNDGAVWFAVETVGPSGSQAMGGWYVNSFKVSDYVTPTAQVKMRFAASDLGDGSVVEAGLDAFRVVRLDCGPAASLSGVVELKLLDASPAGRTVTVEFRDPGTTNVPHSYPATLDGTGHYSVPDVAAGTFDLAVKHDNWLRQVLPSQVVGGATVASFSLDNGDADGDNEVSLLDVNTVLSHFGNAGGTGDLNGDAEVGLIDINITLTNFGLVGDD